MGLDIRYARSSGVAIAHHVVGEGATDLVVVPDFMSNLVYAWESPYYRPFYERLAHSFRVILFDKRGTGLWDRGGSFPTLETRMEDVRAVMDAVGSERALIFGGHEGCHMATLFAATYPERTVGLALFHPIVPGFAEDDEDIDLQTLRDGWGTQEFSDALLALICPTLAETESGREWFANWQRVSASPAMAYELNRVAHETDISDVYAAVRVPTIVLYRDSEPVSTTPAESKAVAAQIPGARCTRVSGSDYWGFFLSPDIVEELEQLTSGDAAPTVPDSVLMTLLFTDIVGSTARAAELGDRAWRDLLAQHNASARRELSRFRGEEPTPRATGSSPRSTALLARSAVRRRSARLSVGSVSRYVRESTPENASCTRERWPASLSRSARGSAARRRAVRSSCPGR